MTTKSVQRYMHTDFQRSSDSENERGALYRYGKIVAATISGQESSGHDRLSVKTFNVQQRDQTLPNTAAFNQDSQASALESLQVSKIERRRNTTQDGTQFLNLSIRISCRQLCFLSLPPPLLWYEFADFQFRTIVHLQRP
jgi:hypothetical protein